MKQKHFGEVFDKENSFVNDYVVGRLEGLVRKNTFFAGIEVSIKNFFY